jgi:breast cancer metastasis-suppressor 1 and related proteins
MKADGDSEAELEAEGASPPESDRSGGSDGRDSSGEEPDSDDSSEMDEGECERRRNECMEIIGKLISQS